MIHELQAFVLSMLVGLLVGFERQKSHPGNETILGVRSFLLVSLLGALAGWVKSSLVSILIVIFVLCLIIASYWFSAKRDQAHQDLGVTTELAAGVIFLLGFISHGSPVLVALLGPVVALILFSKKSLHSFSNRIKWSELQAVILLLLFGAVVLSILKDEAIGPWGLFNPRKFGLIVLTLASFEFFGYVLAKIFGDRASWLIGFLGGLVSSTAITLFTAKKAKQHPQSWKTLGTILMSAQLASLLQLVVIIYFFSRPLAFQIGGAAVASAVMALLSVIWCHYNSTGDGRDLHLSSPLDIKNVLRLSVLLGALLFIVGATEKMAGETATQIVSFITGLFELHAISVTTASLQSQNQIELDSATNSIFIALIASFIAKALIASFISRNIYSRFVIVVIVLLCLAASLGYWLTGLL